MSKQFFNLENIVLGCLFLILLIYSGFMISCDRPDGSLRSNLFSSDDDDNDVSVANRRGTDRRDRRPCEDRDSCQDSCDYMFRNSRSRSECYELNFDDVSELEEVFDKLHASSISVRSLKDIDSDKLEEFLEIDADGWVDIIIGEEGIDHGSGTNKHPAYTSVEAHNALRWIAEEENIARVISRTDEYDDILYHLFLQLGANITTANTNAGAAGTGGAYYLSNTDTNNNGNMDIIWSADKVILDTTDRSLSGPVLKFVLSFIGAARIGTYPNLQFSGESFISYAESEDNESAVDLAHESLVRFCEDATDDELPDEDVQQCMLAAYCSIYAKENNDDIFDDALSNHNADPEHCGAGVLINNTNDRLEDLFD